MMDTNELQNILKTI